MIEPLAQLNQPFETRHIGPSPSEQAEMLALLGYESLDALMGAAVPQGIASQEPMDLPTALSEDEALATLRTLAAKNNPGFSMIGLGYHPTVTPPVIRRNVLEDPSWYTAYTPYQPEISQGRLEALLNFQTMVADLTGLPIANASLLDEATAAAEAMTLIRRASRAKADLPLVVDNGCLPQTLAVVRTRAGALGIPLIEAELDAGLPDAEIFGTLIAYPRADGGVVNPTGIIEATHAAGGLVIVVADLLALAMLKSPGSLGADVVVGSSQRFGVPKFYGGPHAAFMSVRAGLERQLPGRLVGVSIDAEGRPAYRLALQTREQHIRREKATSNICTAQVLLAVIASMYGVYHGADGLRQIALRIAHTAAALARGLKDRGWNVSTTHYFDTITIDVGDRQDTIIERASQQGINLRRLAANGPLPSRIGISVDETTTPEIVESVWAVFGARDARRKDEDDSFASIAS